MRLWCSYDECDRIAKDDLLYPESIASDKSVNNANEIHNC